MENKIFRYIIFGAILLLLQLLLVDNIMMSRHIYPCVYVLFFFILPVEMKSWAQILTAFAFGTLLDVFLGTPGLNAAASTMTAFLRSKIIKEETSRQQILYFSILLGLLHFFVLFMLEAFTFRLFWHVVLKTLCSGLFSAILIVLLYLLFREKNMKKKY